MVRQDEQGDQARERPAEPPSPATDVVREQEDLPEEGGMPRRGDVDPGDHRPRREDES